MRNKCLGCGKVFEDTISICQECFQAIEKARGEMSVCPQDFSKKQLLKWRKTVLLACLALMGAIIFSILVCTYILWRINLAFPPSYILTIFLSAAFFLFIGLYLGALFNKVLIKWLIGIFLRKEGHLGGIRRINRRLYRSPILFSAALGLITTLLFSHMFYQIDKFSFSYVIFSTIVLMGGAVCSQGYFIGRLINFYFSTDWIKKLSK